MCLISCKIVPPVSKQSPEVSVTAAAIKDSFDAARVDLASSYADALAMLIVPPEKRIEIKPVYKDGKRIAVIPERYKDYGVLAVGTTEWENLLKIKDVAVQLANDQVNLNAQIITIREELREQQRLKEQLADDNAKLIKENNEISSKLFKRTVYLISILALIAGYIYLKITKIVPFI